MKPHARITSVLSRHGLRPAVVTLVMVASLLGGCAHVTPPQTTTPTHTSTARADSTRQPSEPMPELQLEPANGEFTANRDIRKGIASFYGQRFAGQLTANGERFDPSEMTAAHRSLPFGTRVQVTNLNNGEQVIVRINDRGPYVGSRILDLSRGAAKKIGMLESGTAPVRLRVLD